MGAMYLFQIHGQMSCKLDGSIYDAALTFRDDAADLSQQATSYTIAKPIF